MHKNRLQTCINNLQIVLTQQIYEKNNRLLPDWKDSGGLQQVSRMMKCVLFFMLTLVCGVQGKVYSQQYTLDLHLKQTSLEEVFNRIEAQTGLKFLYNTLLTDS